MTYRTILASRSAAALFALAVAAAPSVAQEQVPVDGTLYEILEGNIYEVDGDARHFVAELYDPEHLTRSYRVIDGVIHRIAPSDGAAYPVLDVISEGFDGAPDVAAHIGPETGWTALTLQSPYAPNVPDYVDLWQRFARGEDGCHDNCVDLVEVDGEAVMRATAVAPRRNAVSKASLDTGLLHLTVGETFRFSADFRIDEGMPVSVVDFEASYMREGPGLRVMLSEDGVPWVQLKWADNPRWMPVEPVSVPRGEWFTLTLEAELATAEGHVRLWLDDQLLIDAPGPTLPLTDAVLDRMELGVTAATDGPVVLLVDNVAFSEVR